MATAFVFDPQDVQPGETSSEAYARQRAAHDESADPDDPVFLAGADNTDFWKANVVDMAALEPNLAAALRPAVITSGVNNGFADDGMAQFWDAAWSPTYRGGQGALGYLDDLLMGEDIDTNFLTINDVTAQGIQQIKDNQLDYFMSDPKGFEVLTIRMWDWFAKQLPYDPGTLGSVQTGPSGGRGSGRRGMTEEEIRNSFDLDLLSDQATQVWRGMLLDEPENARAMATAYVDAIVASKAEKKIDFQQFIREKARLTGRHASIYRSKPETMGEEEYLGRYWASAQQVARPDEAAAAAIGGAQFGASAGAFAQRLARTDAATSSAGYINSLHGRLSELNKVFKG